MSKSLSPIPKVYNKITLRINSALRDAIEHLEPDAKYNNIDLYISTHGELFMYEDGHKLFRWKGKDTILFYPIKPELDEYGHLQLDFSFEKLYEEIE